MTGTESGKAACSWQRPCLGADQKLEADANNPRSIHMLENRFSRYTMEKCYIAHALESEFRDCSLCV